MKTRKLSAVILMSVVLFCVSSAYAADYKTKITLSIAAAAPTYDETYTLTIPATLAVQNSGWNEIGSITVKHETAGTTFDPTKQLVITASSTNSFKLKATGVTDEISYFLATSANDTSATTTLNFTAAEINAEGGTSKTIGINVEDYSSKQAGEYEDEITYAVEVLDTNITTASIESLLTDGVRADLTVKHNGNTITAYLTRNSQATATGGFNSPAIVNGSDGNTAEGYRANGSYISDSNYMSITFFKDNSSIGKVWFNRNTNVYSYTDNNGNIEFVSLKIGDATVQVTQEQ